MNLKYGNMKDVTVGSVVEDNEKVMLGITFGKLYVVLSVSENSIKILDDDESEREYYADFFKLVKTSPMSEMKSGDKIIRVCGTTWLDQIKIGTVCTSKKSISESVWVSISEPTNNAYFHGDFVKLDIEPEKVFSVYYNYFKNLYDAGVKLQHNSVSNGEDDSCGFVDTNVDHVFNSNFRFRLASHPKDCPQPNTPEYLEYWQKIARNEDVVGYRQGGGVYDCSHPKNTVVQYRVFTTKEEFNSNTTKVVEHEGKNLEVFSDERTLEKILSDEEKMLDLYSDLSDIRDNYREYPSEREAGDCMTIEGLELQLIVIEEFIEDNPDVTSIPKEVLADGDEDMRECIEYLQYILKLKLNNPEEDKMKDTVEVDIKVNGKVIDAVGSKAARKVVVKTDLQSAPKVLAIWYDAQGVEREISRFTFKVKSPKAFNKKFDGVSVTTTKALQTPDRLGWSVRLYAFKTEFTTNIPVVIVK